MIGLGQDRQGEMGESQRNLLRAIDINPVSACALNLKGRLAYKQGGKSDAEIFFKKAIETDNAALYSHYYLGLIYYQGKKYELSKEQFKFVWENEPVHHEKHYMEINKKMARFYIRQIDRITKKKS